MARLLERVAPPFGSPRYRPPLPGSRGFVPFPAAPVAAPSSWGALGCPPPCGCCTAAKRILSAVSKGPCSRSYASSLVSSPSVLSSAIAPSANPNPFACAARDPPSAPAGPPPAWPSCAAGRGAPGAAWGAAAAMAAAALRPTPATSSSTAANSRLISRTRGVVMNSTFKGAVLEGPTGEKGVPSAEGSPHAKLAPWKPPLGEKG